MITISYPAFVVIVHPSQLFLKSNIYPILVFGISIILPIIMGQVFSRANEDLFGQRLIQKIFNILGYSAPIPSQKNPLDSYSQF